MFYFIEVKKEELDNTHFSIFFFLGGHIGAMKTSAGIYFFAHNKQSFSEFANVEILSHVVVLCY